MSASNRGKTRQRIALFAGGSLAAATIAAVAGGVALAPGVARAANECAPVGTAPSDNGATADTFICAGAATYTASGITYSSAGALTVNSTGAMNVGTTGINLTGAGADPVTFTATGAVTGTSGPVIDVATGSGAISITTAGITGSALGVTYGINAVSTGGGAIAINNTSGAINVSSFTTPSQLSAVRAVSTGGNGNVSVSTGGAITAQVRGIEARASGTGTLTITTTATMSGAFLGTPTAMIDATTGTGLLTVNIATGSGTVGAAGAASILTNAGGSAVINIAAGRIVSPGLSATSTAALLNLTAAGTTTVNNAGSISGLLAIRAAGGAFVLNNTGSLAGAIDFGTLTGASTINNNAGATWTLAAGSVSQFGAGVGDLNSAGTITFGVSSTGGTFGVLNELATFDGLETFDNSGTINFGATRNRVGQVLSAPGAAFTASGASLLLMEAFLRGDGQDSCAAAAIADCLDLTGGETSGVTAIRVTAIPDDLAQSEPVTTAVNPGIVLVDVSGGTSHAGDFVLASTSTNYAADPIYGAVLTTGGLFDYALLYDPDTQQHLLASAPQRGAVEYVSFIQEALSVWQTTSDAVAGRQADLRAGASDGVWLRVVGEHTARDAAPTATIHGETFAYDAAYTLDTGAVIGGYELASGDSYVVGLHGGYVTSQVKYDASATVDKTIGGTVGAYAGWWSDNGLTLDGAFNANVLQLEHRVAGFEESDSNVISLGARAEAGWRWAASEAFYLQPLATATYVRAQIEDLALRDYDLSFEGAESVRGALGLRVGGAAALEGGRLGYWLTGRAWREFSGDGEVLFTAGAGGVAIEDDLSGDFQEIDLGASFSNAANTMSAFVSGGAKIADTIDNYTLSLGARLRW